MQYVDATSNETLSIYSPHDESLVLDGVQVASQPDVDKAVAAARAACKYDQDS
jgi:aldehyde dehydrogenase (NAD+)